MSSISVSQRFNNCVDYLKQGYTNKVKPKLTESVKYTKDLKNDVVDFVKKNPKKTGAAAAVTLLGASLIGLVAKLAKDNVKMHQISAIKSEHIEHQREIIDALKEDITDRQYMMDSQHEALDALHNTYNSLRDQISYQTGE